MSVVAAMVEGAVPMVSLEIMKWVSMSCGLSGNTLLYHRCVGIEETWRANTGSSLL